MNSGVMDQEIKDQQGGSEVSARPSDPVSTETVIMVRSAEAESASVDGDGVGKSEQNVIEMKKVVKDKLKVNVAEQKSSCVVDVKCSGGALEGENWDVENVCRICHLSAESPSPNEASDLIQLGCGCKDELGIAHRHCAETWFKLKGNRCCEICGEAAKNITGMWDNRFMEEWNDARSVGGNTNTLNRRWGFWRGQPFCNFLMACLVMAFVLPWFFRVNMF